MLIRTNAFEIEFGFSTFYVRFGNAFAAHWGRGMGWTVD